MNAESEMAGADGLGGKPLNRNAAKADRVVASYSSDASLEECLSDLLGDLRHFCDAYGIDYAERDGVGHRNYLAEWSAERDLDAAEGEGRR